MERSDYKDVYSVARDPLIWEQHPDRYRFLPECFQKYFESMIASESAFVVMDKSTHLIIGCTRFKIIEAFDSTIEIGWTFLSRKYWGGKFNRAIKVLMIRHALQDFDRVVLIIGRRNIRSQKATEKIGGRLCRDDRVVSKLVNHIDDLVYIIGQPFNLDPNPGLSQG